MAYVTVSDPTIIDLAAWQQLINVVNQHSDSIAALTNNFGMAWTQIYTDGDTNWASPFDFGSSMIQFGRSKIIIATALKEGTAPNEVYYEEVLFTSAFSANPVVIATPYQAGSTITSNVDTLVTTYNLSKTGFTYRFSDNADHPFTAKTYINWIAIGPK